MKMREATTKTGKIIQRLMHENEIDDLSELASRTGVKQPTLHRILYIERRESRSDTLKPIADYFGVSMPQIRGEEFYSPKPPHLRLTTRGERIAKKWESLPPRLKDCVETLIDSYLETREKTAVKHG